MNLSNLRIKVPVLIGMAITIVLGLAKDVKSASLVEDISENPFLLEVVNRSSFPNTVSDDLAEELDLIFAETTDDIPGAFMAIISPRGTWLGTSGFSQLETQTPLTVEDRFEIGSITKIFVATTVLQLVEEGTLTLEDTLDQWLPDQVLENIPNAEQITIRQLLNHTSGIVDYTLPLFFQAQRNPGVFLQEWQPEELLTFISNQEPYFSPGESWEYCNTNVILLGLILETATQSNIAAEIRSRILEPLALNNTFFAEEEEIPGGYVDAYWDFDQDGTFNNVSQANLSWAWAAGAMVSNPTDMARFIAGLLTGDILEPESLAEMLTVVKPIDSNNYDAYGLGIGVLESPIRQWYGHRGLTLAHRSNLFYSPTDDVIYIELINSRDLDNISNPVFRAWRQAQEPIASVPEPGILSAFGVVLVGEFLIRFKRQADRK
ncbi:serine hydrolase domain-containing protein [Limnoraphis robusta Tam1]|uniref:Serine hydrolase domain-containing protein n=1 Tax=Limnoraphis robusta CCNP1315 TaxID=3110306 RepID=A0ABU5TTC6_9CYAN|nr:serine hydrolase domain-containing protein [Limnoraphis robusta]MEA5517947.1 serine hydrolase domain-containing protein [Limnoraphis robusta CCNP1315]MEA5538999.1 serine hydrolase domain-containing protein [Limnoraphis robusta Tam1]MEA5543712.1 serine hydrolase domain-containing protein [Limnoraphis robusta CCNP1324]